MLTISEINKMSLEKSNKQEDWDKFFDRLEQFFLSYFEGDEVLVNQLQGHSLQLYCDMDTLDLPEIKEFVVPCEKLRNLFDRGLITKYELWSSQLLKDFGE